MTLNCPNCNKEIPLFGSETNCSCGTNAHWKLNEKGEYVIFCIGFFPRRDRSLKRDSDGI